MQPEQIKQALKDWGWAVQNRFASSRQDRNTHVLQAVRDHAPGTAENAMRDLVGRDGSGRRRYMAERSCVVGLKILPTWSVDPLSCPNDAGSGVDREEIPVDLGIPDHLRWVDRMVQLMDQVKPVMAACVRQEYCTVGSQEVKSRRVADQLGLAGAFTKWNYRAELDKAVVWMEGFAAAA